MDHVPSSLLHMDAISVVALIVAGIDLAAAVAMVIGYIVIASVPWLRIFFDLMPLTPTIHAGILLTVLV